MQIIRGPMLTFSGDPFLYGEGVCMRYEEDAAVAVENGLIVQSGNAALVAEALGEQKWEEAERVTYPGSLILPGFIDGHVHYSQVEVMASYGAQLLDWLHNYTFPAERRFRDPEFAAGAASFFLDEMLKNGTTSCCAFCTVHPQSVEALFAEAEKRGLRLAAGKVCMDREAPEWLLDTPQRAYDESRDLIRSWHGRGRLEYAITPRFAPSSSPEQLEALGGLAGEYPDLIIQSHISENLKEIALVKELFPAFREYADVYDRYGLLRPRAVYGHGVHLSERQFRIFHERGAAIIHCPDSNFFIGSGCFRLDKAKDRERPVLTGLGTDIGGGTSFSMLRAMAGAYKAAQLNGYALSPARAFYLATRGGAESLGLAAKVGSIQPGLEADLTILDLKATPLLARRMYYAENIQEALFILMTLGDERAVRAVYSGGNLVYSKAA